jgi:ADP-dependent NAD(P)H-hydrate dehydratase / NAD(P)H-hydrate epimerase
VQRIHPGTKQPLLGVAATRQIEERVRASLPEHALMQRAGLAVAKLALAIAPHAQRIWIACGPGNNGGDGLEAALHLLRWGKEPIVTWLGKPGLAPMDAATSYERAALAGVTFSQGAPTDVQLCIDALLGIGACKREPEAEMAGYISQINGSGAPILAVDVPTGLDADTGTTTQLHIKATHTLSLLTLKPGLFTAHGRDACGTIWLDDLQVAHEERQSIQPNAFLPCQPVPTARAHASHKGTLGDVAVLGGAPGMTGAALLAASAALHAGAGRVFVGLLDGGSLSVDASQPELMFRPIDTLNFDTMTVVCGCGGGEAVGPVLSQVLLSSAPVVIDADALNLISKDAALQALLRSRASHTSETVLTPHPLEAARLLGCTAAQVQQDRLDAATRLAQQFACTVILKGSGTVIATPKQTPVINPTGNARLATAGTGDVLAGLVGAKLAAGAPAFQAACEAAYQHGKIADSWPVTSVLTASGLALQPTETHKDRYQINSY